jgi:hypothetical protein
MPAQGVTGAKGEKKLPLELHQAMMLDSLLRQAMTQKIRIKQASQR